MLSYLIGWIESWAYFLSLTNTFILKRLDYRNNYRKINYLFIHIASLLSTIKRPLSNCWLVKIIRIDKQCNVISKLHFLIVSRTLVPCFLPTPRLILWSCIEFWDIMIVEWILIHTGNCPFKSLYGFVPLIWFYENMSRALN